MAALTRYIILRLSSYDMLFFRIASGRWTDSPHFLEKEWIWKERTGHLQSPAIRESIADLSVLLLKVIVQADPRLATNNVKLRLLPRILPNDADKSLVSFIIMALQQPFFLPIRSIRLNLLP